ncbi:NAD(P)/FAD-dependent oxidoreductase [Roseiconus nitratireducens]|uniref:NAD(P)/FAD-dependent oxidoreductase n=1 Tax=Roseiconus nitratireducens TaxID=2605748 RepID=A0A5M6D2G2_9BACT|nr:NAD(P)/FAD-dependent oxidoreductase [Roseiconus nitratireducens]KAA5540482.1 NAD(P)/FAD-dependent oxidoreductase [Roseiconus nitratireducens]
MKSPSQTDHPSAGQDANPDCEVVIIGAGLAGLSCAKRLCELGRRVVLLEATDRVGGRVRSDVVDGLTLDHGFQVLLTAYPACRELLDYSALRLRPFQPGALLRHQGRFVELADPWRQPSRAWATATSPVGSLGDKWRVAKARWQANRGSLDDLYHRGEESTELRLRKLGFSQAMVDQFFRPFLGGVFLDESLQTSSRMFEFVFRMFSSGEIAVPADGMAAIPRQLADGLPRGTLRLNRTVANIESTADASEVHLTDGSVLRAPELVIATESDSAARLLGQASLQTEWNATTTLYFTAEASPFADDRQRSRRLMLRGDETGTVQTAVVLSDVAPEYASRGRSLISVSVSDSVREEATETLAAKARNQLQGWFGETVGRWELVQTYRVPYGVPKVALDPVMRSVDPRELLTDGSANQIPEHLSICGDHCETPSIQGAMNSGLRAARRVAERLEAGRSAASALSHR